MDQDFGVSVSLGDLITALKTCQPTACIFFDFCLCVPDGTLDSWRGDYAHLALGWRQLHDITVGGLLKRLEDAPGRTYTGYKGGEYVASLSTPVHVDTYGRASNTTITRLLDRGEFVYLVTRSDVG